MKKSAIFVLGGVAGAAAALMLAPRPGDETRAIMTDWASNALGDNGNLGERLEVRKMQITHDAGVIANQAGALAATGVEKAKGAIGNVQAPQPFAKQEPDTDAELRARIEQARARIASQVAENAARTAQATGEAVPGVVEAAKNTANVAKDTAATAVEAVKGKAE